MQEIEELIKNLQPLKPQTLNQENEILTQYPHTPFLFQPLSPAENQCYEEKSLNYIPIIRPNNRPIFKKKFDKRSDFKWNIALESGGEGKISADGHYVVTRVEPKDLMWMVFDETESGPFTNDEMILKMELNELDNLKIKKVNDVEFVKFEDFRKDVDNPFLIENVNCVINKIENLSIEKREENVENVKLTANCPISKTYLTKKGYKHTLNELFDKIYNKTMAHAVVIIKKETGMNLLESEDFLELLINESKIKICKESDAVDFVKSKKQWNNK
ncbi:hypothetical protein GVAV_000740 [Gurleya vavrai]